ncbi:MAG TPA: signal peptidase I, partial [Rubricoccaceae bacterium]
MESPRPPEPDPTAPPPTDVASPDGEHAAPDASDDERTRPGRPSAGWAWVRVIGGAVLAAVLLRALVFEAYRIPSESMEGTLLIGDFVFVSKLAYGPTVLGRHLPGLRAPRRGDVAVFHYPPGLEPRVADRMPYIKRVVGLPGDTVSVVAKRVVVNGETAPPPPLGLRFWTLQTDGPPPSADAFRAAGLEADAQRLGRGLWVTEASPRDAPRLAGVEGVLEVRSYVRPRGDGSAAFPISRRYSLDDYGPVVVPRRGLTVPLDDDSYGLYRVAIERDEGHRLERTATGFAVDGRPAEAYTFEGDYLF